MQTAGDQIKLRLAGFIDTLRQADFDASAVSVQMAHEVICTPIIENPHTFKQALRSVFCHSKTDWQAYDDLFDTYWLKSASPQTVTDISEGSVNEGGITTGLGYFSESQAQAVASSAELDPESTTTAGGASDAQVLAQRDFRFVFNAKEMRKIEHAVEKLASKIQKRTRRRTRHSKTRGRLDLRRTSRQNLRYGGWCFDLTYKKTRRSPAKFLLLIDVSQSMEIYSYLFLRFTRGLLQAFGDADAYAFHTDLIPIGSEMKEKSPTLLEEKLKKLSSGWLGGTRIAQSLHDFNRLHARSVINRHTNVIIFSDGYDSGEPEDLLDEVLLIKERCRKLAWVNPLLGRDGDQSLDLPIERGMKLVVPHLDMYASAHSLQSLQELAPAFSYR